MLETNLIHFKRMPFLIYKSSAGSGKTYTLVKEYLKIALASDENFRRILAVTFTNKAAEEMKTRIINAMANISSRSSDKLSAVLFQDLKKETGLADEQIVISSGRVLQNVLHGYSDFAVSTIDSFVHNIVRHFARDLKLSWNFEVETEEIRMLSETVDLLINSVGKNEPLTRSLIGFVESQTEDEKDWHIENPLNKLAKSLLDDESMHRLESLNNMDLEIFERVRKQLFTFTRQIESQINAIASNALQLIDQNELSETDFYQRSKGIAGYFRKLESDFAVDHLFPNSYVKESIDTHKWYTRQIHENNRRKIESIKPRLTECFKSIQQIVAQNHNNYVISRVILQRIYSLSVLNQINDLLAQLKQEKNFILISEFNRRIHEVVSQESIPFIFERIGEKYEHYLIDEFQDTSLLQWSNLLPLVDNSLAAGHLSMVVGDGKQAIYRFRNGDVEQFDLLPKIRNENDNPTVSEHEASLIRHHDIRSLDINYRSSKNIVNFNNALYEFLSQLPELSNKGIYRNHSQQHLAENTGGYITIDFLAPDKENTFNQNVLNKTMSLIESLRKEGFSRNEIAILTRSNSDAIAIAGFLMQNGISVVSAESVLIHKSSDVRFIVSVFQYLTDSSNVIAKAEILHYLHEQSGLPDAVLDDSFAGIKEPDYFFKKIESYGFSIYFRSLSFLSLYEIAETIISKFSLNREANLFVQHFLDVVLLYSIREGNSIDSFLGWWEENKASYSVTLPIGIDAVHVLTIHKSKGLEFPVVIVPKADWKIENTKDEIWISPDLPFAPDLEHVLVACQKDLKYTDFAERFEEEVRKSFLDNLNLLYVATTRAKGRLHIFCSAVQKEPDNNNSINALFIHFLQSISRWDINRTFYDFGDATSHRQIESKNPISEYVITSPSSFSWRQRIRIKQTASEFWPKTEMSKTDWGNMVHAALAKIITVGDIHYAVKELEFTGRINSELSLRLEQNLTSLLSQDNISPFFEPGLTVKTEAEMFLAGKGMLRIDRVILKDNNAIVIDYKTGQTQKEDYVIQLNQYAEAIHSMGYSKVDKYLLYTDEKILEKI
ncbi:AAA family ATPase [bacterium]|nr:MAG: AAA family ATPase [bacterium]